MSKDNKADALIESPQPSCWRSGGLGERAKAEARDGGGVGVWAHLEGAEDLDRRGGLVAEPEDEDAGLDFFGREQVEAAGLLPEFDLCSSRGGERDIGQSVAKRGVACLIEGGEPVVEEAAGGVSGMRPTWSPKRGRRTRMVG